jgi:hypothetical protein
LRSIPPSNKVSSLLTKPHTYRAIALHRPFETALFQAFSATPKPRAVPEQQLDPASGPIAKTEPHARSRVQAPVDPDFDFFVIQKPTAPFGLSWYQGDIETNRFGVGFERFVGRFNIETFIVAPGTQGVPAPTPHTAPPFPDASTNPITAPVHTFHLGLWFNSPKDAKKAGGPETVTPFNGEHNAGVQVLNTSSFKDLEGPLSHVKPTP